MALPNNIKTAESHNGLYVIFVNMQSQVTFSMTSINMYGSMVLRSRAKALKPNSWDSHTRLITKQVCDVGQFH